MVEGAKSPPRHDVDRYCVSGYFLPCALLILLSPLCFELLIQL